LISMKRGCSQLTSERIERKELGRALLALAQNDGTISYTSPSSSNAKPIIYGLGDGKW